MTCGRGGEASRRVSLLVHSQPACSILSGWEDVWAKHMGFGEFRSKCAVFKQGALLSGITMPFPIVPRRHRIPSQLQSACQQQTEYLWQRMSVVQVFVSWHVPSQHWSWQSRKHKSARNVSKADVTRRLVHLQGKKVISQVS